MAGTHLLAALLLVAAAAPAHAALQPQPAAAASAAGASPLSGSGGDFLSENGLSSPLCRNPALPPSAREGCEGSGFSGSAVPLGNYAFDVHINTGLTEPANDVAAATEDLAQWGWLALVAVVRGVLVMLEWAYSLHLLGGVVLASVSRTLAGLEHTFTLPGLAFTLTVLAATVAWWGLVRRRHAHGVGEAAAAVGMVVAGLVLVADPQGTVGRISALSDQGALGTVGVFSGSGGSTSVAGAVGELYRATVFGPWCYLEFGQVPWCSSPRALDSELKAAAAGVAARARYLAQSAGGAQRTELLLIADHLEAAKDNGELFLALPANGPARNSINETSSLLHVLCGGSSDATNCQGPTAREAEFRTQNFLGQRLVGLVLIWGGALGAICVFGWVVTRLIGASVLALLLLFAAPAVVVAPPLGPAGRNLFRAWAVRLVGALTAKLLFSVLLGVLILIEQTLAGVEGLGFWLYWLLAGGAWWLIFLNRHALLATARFAGGQPWQEATPRGTGTRVAHSYLRGARATGRRIGRGLASVAKRRPPDPGQASAGGPLGPGPKPPPKPLPPPSPSGPAALGEALLAAELGLARAWQRSGQSGEEEVAARLARIARQRDRSQRLVASTPGAAAARRERRRLVSLAARERRLGERLQAARQQAAAREALLRGKGRRRLRAYQAFIDRQQQLPPATKARVGARRDYPRLAPLVGLDQQSFLALAGAERYQAILSIDRVLAGQRRTGPTPNRRPREAGPEQTLAGWVAREQRREAARAARGQPPPDLEERLAAEEEWAARLRRQLGGGRRS